MNTQKQTISKQFKRLQDAERFQNQLYGKFDSVTLTDFPRFSQDGRYVWTVGRKLSMGERYADAISTINP